MWFDYNLDDDSLASAFQSLERAITKAQDQLYATTHMINCENFFKRNARIITGYNQRLLRQYVRHLDHFIVKSSEVLQSYKIAERAITNEEHKSRLCAAVEWCIYLYYDLLKDKKTFKEKQASHLIDTLYEMLDNVNHLIYHAIVTIEYEDSLQKQDKVNIEQKRGYIDINQYMIDYF